MKMKFFFASYLGTMLCIFAVNALSQNTFVNWSTFDMGFGVPTASNTVIKSAVGQAFVGTSLQANTRLESGFLADTLLRGMLVAVREDKSLPAVFALRQNYPNPFNPSTTIRYELPKAAYVTLLIYSVLGQTVETLVDEEQSAGFYQVKVEASRLSSGVYFYRLLAGTFIETKKLLLVR